MPGESVDLSLNLVADASIDVAYSGAHETTTWKIITFSPRGEMQIFEQGRGPAAKIVFTAPSAGHFSVRWTNAGTTTFTLDAAVDTGEGATIHSWAQSWVPRDEP